MDASKVAGLAALAGLTMTPVLTAAQDAVTDGAASGKDMTVVERSGTLRGEEEPVVLSDYVFGKFYTPRVCPHDQSIYSVESVSDEGNRAWLVFEKSHEVREVMTFEESIGSLSAGDQEYYSGQVAWCPEIVRPGDYWYAFVSTGSSGNTDIYLGSTRRDTPVRLVDTPGVDGEPAWSPDGDHLVYLAGGSEFGDVYVLDGMRAFLRGGGGGTPPIPRRLTSGSASDAYPVVSPDGTWVLFARRQPAKGTGSDLYVAPLAPSRELVLATEVSRLPGEETRPSWSADGRWVGFYYSETVMSRKVDLYVARPVAHAKDGAPKLESIRKLVDDVEPDLYGGPSFSPYYGGGNVRSVLYLARGGNESTLQYVDLRKTYHDGKVVGGRLPSELDGLSGFDFSIWTRGLICGQKGTEYRVHRITLWGESFLSLPYELGGTQ